MRNFVIVGLTGSTGAGKSTVSKVFERSGFAVINADKVAREILEPNGSCISQLAAAFGGDIIKADGTLDRGLLASRAFLDESSLKKLNDITHPHILSRTLALCREHINSGRNRIVFDAPVLFESNSDLFCDIIVSVTAPKDVRIERLMKRDGISREAVELRISAQHGDEFYTSRSDYVINGGEELPEVERRTLEIISEISLPSLSAALD